MVGVEPHQGRHVESGREPGLAVVEQVAEALVRLLHRPEAGELAHRPQPAPVHRGIGAARVRVLAGITEVALGVGALAILLRVERPDRLAGDRLEAGVALRLAAIDLLEPLVRASPGARFYGHGRKSRAGAGQDTGGRLSAHGRSASICGGERQQRRLVVRRPTSWTESGRPSSSNRREPRPPGCRGSSRRCRTGTRGSSRAASERRRGPPSGRPRPAATLLTSVITTSWSSKIRPTRAGVLGELAARPAHAVAAVGAAESREAARAAFEPLGMRGRAGRPGESRRGTWRWPRRRRARSRGRPRRPGGRVSATAPRSGRARRDGNPRSGSADR